MREAINREDEYFCARCGAARTDNISSNICGSCADDLRAERDAEAEEYHQLQLREATGE